MATKKHNPLDLLGAHVRGQYVLRDGSVAFECSFDGIVESVVADLHPDHLGEVFVGGEYHYLGDCTEFEILLPPALADRNIPSINAVRML